MGSINNKFKAFNYKINIRIMKNHIITFNDNSITLYDLNGNFLHYLNVPYFILDIRIINDNIFFLEFKNKLIFISIFDDELITIFDLSIIKYIDFLYMKESNNLIISTFNNIMILYLNNFSSFKAIISQNINLKQRNLLKIKKNIFIAYNISYISIFKKKDTENIYQLVSTLRFGEINNLIKINSKTLLVSQIDQIYFVFLDKMKLELINLPLTNMNLNNNEEQKIYFMNSIDNYVFLYKNNTFHILYYSNKNLKLITSIKQNEYNTLNYVYNFYIERKYPKVSIRIKLRDKNFKFKDSFEENENIKFIDILGHTDPYTNINKIYFKKEIIYFKIQNNILKNKIKIFSKFNSDRNFNHNFFKKEKKYKNNKVKNMKYFYPKKKFKKNNR